MTRNYRENKSYFLPFFHGLRPFISTFVHRCLDKVFIDKSSDPFFPPPSTSIRLEFRSLCGSGVAGIIMRGVHETSPDGIKIPFSLLSVHVSPISSQNNSRAKRMLMILPSSSSSPRRTTFKSLKFLPQSTSVAFSSLQPPQLGLQKTKTGGSLSAKMPDMSRKNTTVRNIFKIDWSFQIGSFVLLWKMIGETASYCDLYRDLVWRKIEPRCEIFYNRTQMLKLIKMYVKDNMNRNICMKNRAKSSSWWAETS